MTRLPFVLCVIFVAACGSPPDQPGARSEGVPGTYVGDKEQLEKDIYPIREKQDAARLETMSAEERRVWQQKARKEAADVAAAWDFTLRVTDDGRFSARVAQQGAAIVIHEGTWTHEAEALVCEATRTVDESGRLVTHDFPAEWMTFRFRIAGDVLYLPVPAGMAFEYVLRRED